MRYLGIPKSEFAKRAKEALGLVRMDGFERRTPDQLSGGQRQRVALARALALKPEVLLLDEPLGALDQKLRREVQVELKSLQRTLGITFVFVTHDQEEALTMSDRIAVMNAGRVEQCAASSAVFESPRTEFVANFMGASNFFTATVKGTSGGSLSLGPVAGVELEVAAGESSFREGDLVRLAVRPEKLDLGSKDLSSQGVPSMEVTVEDRVYQGASTVWIVRDADGNRFAVSRQNGRPIEDPVDPAAGSRVFMSWNARHTILMQGPPGRG
jgi:spermidine/putrescine transport system ATP-binding protein